MTDRGAVGVVAAFAIFGLFYFAWWKDNNGTSTTTSPPTEIEPEGEKYSFGEIEYEKEVGGRTFAIRTVINNKSSEVVYQVGTLTDGSFNPISSVTTPSHWPREMKGIFLTFGDAEQWIDEQEPETTGGPEKLPPKEKPKDEGRGSLPSGPSDATQDQYQSPFDYSSGAM